MNAKLFHKSPAIWAMLLIAMILLSACAAPTVIGTSPDGYDVLDTDDATRACQYNPGKTVVLKNTMIITCPAAANNATVSNTAAPTQAVVITGGPRAMKDGVTDCVYAETLTKGKGTVEDPLVYPDGWVHDLCWARAGNGTGAKYIVISGPVALQNGEATGPVRMILVLSGKKFTGWTQGGWGYTTDTAMLAQWSPENVAMDKLGLICGYSKALKLTVPAYRWDGTKENRDVTLDCPYSVTALFSTNLVSMTPMPMQTTVPTTKTGYDFKSYPEIFKVENNSTFYCGARANDAKFPNGTRIIETWQKNAGDGDFLLDGGANGLSSNKGFCKGDAPNNKPWTTALLEPNRFKTVTFPLK